MEITIRRALPEDAFAYTTCVISCLQTAYKGIMADEYLSSLEAERENKKYGKLLVQFKYVLELTDLTVYRRS